MNAFHVPVSSPFVIEGLERVAWAELSHAYGPAGDVPDLLRRMAGTDETDVITAQEELRGSILHQGSVCTATTPAVPFLGALLADPARVHPGGIAHLLGDMADIRDPDDPDLADLRAAVTAQVDRLLPLLTAADAYTRQVAAFALAHCPGRAHEIIPALQERWTTEPEPAVRGCIVIAVVTLDPDTGLLREALAEHQPPGVRAGAAIAAGRSGQWSDDAVDAVRAGWAERDPWFDRDDDEWPEASEVGYPWAWDPIDDLLAHADQPPTVAALLASAHPAVREKAAQLAGCAAGERRSMREPMAAALTPALADPDPRVRAAAAWAIHRAGAMPEELATLAHHDTGEAGNTALVALVERGDPRARDLLPTRLTAELANAGPPADPELLDAVRQRLVTLPADAPFDIDVQIARLRAGERPVSHDAERRALVELLASWGPDAAPAIPELVTLLTEDQAVTAVAKALTAIGPAAIVAVPALRDHAANVAAATALWRLTGDPEPAVETAADLLDSDELGVIELIAEIGDPARRLLPRMRARLMGEPGTSQYDQSSHIALARLLWQWTDDTEAARAAAQSVMANGWPAPRAKAADLAAELGDPTAIDTLRTVLTEHDTWARLLAAQALWRHTRKAEVPTLMEILTSRPNERILRKTLDAFTELGPTARPAIPTCKPWPTRTRQSSTTAPTTTSPHSMRPLGLPSGRP
jgi:hypothetical protein